MSIPQGHETVTQAIRSQVRDDLLFRQLRDDARRYANAAKVAATDVAQMHVPEIRELARTCAQLAAAFAATAELYRPRSS